MDVGTEAAEVASEASRTGRQRPEVRTAGSALVRGDRQRVNGLLAALVEGADWWGAAGPVRVAVDGSSPDAVTVTVARSGDPGAHREPAAILSGDAIRASEPGHPGGALLLAVAVAVARAHGGRLTVGSAEGVGGVSFELRLPRQPVRGGSLH